MSNYAGMVKSARTGAFRKNFADNFQNMRQIEGTLAIEKEKNKILAQREENEIEKAKYERRSKSIEFMIKGREAAAKLSDTLFKKGFSKDEIAQRLQPLLQSYAQGAFPDEDTTGYITNLIKEETGNLGTEKRKMTAPESENINQDLSTSREFGGIAKTVEANPRLESLMGGSALGTLAKARMGNFGGAILDVAKGVRRTDAYQNINPNDRTAIDYKTLVVQPTERAFQTVYRKAVTGVQAGGKELDLLRKDMPNPNKQTSAAFKKSVARVQIASLMQAKSELEGLAQSGADIRGWEDRLGKIDTQIAKLCDLAGVPIEATQQDIVRIDGEVVPKTMDIAAPSRASLFGGTPSSRKTASGKTITFN